MTDSPEDFNLQQGTSSSYGEIKTTFDGKEATPPLPSLGTFIPVAAKTIPPQRFNLKPVGGEMGPKAPIIDQALLLEKQTRLQEKQKKLLVMLLDLGKVQGRVTSIINSADFEALLKPDFKDTQKKALSSALSEIEKAFTDELDNDNSTNEINDFKDTWNKKIHALEDTVSGLEIILKERGSVKEQARLEDEARLQRLQTHLVTFAKLDARVEELFNKKGVPYSDLQGFYDLKDTLVWLKNPAENTMSDEDTVDTLAVMDSIVSGLESAIQKKVAEELEALRTQLADALEAATATPATPTDAPSIPSPRRRVDLYLPDTIRENGPHSWELYTPNKDVVGTGTWKKIPDAIKGRPRPTILNIIATLQDYGGFIEYIKKEKLGEEYYLQVAALKDEILDALETSDFSLADTNAKELYNMVHEADILAKGAVFTRKKTGILPPGIFGGATPTTPGATPEDTPTTPESREKFLDIYSGWPIDIIELTKGKNGVLTSGWKLRTDSGFADLMNGPLWASLQSNFNEEFNTYIQFLKQGDKNRKQLECVDLITEKNAIRQALLELDTTTAGALITVFRQSLEETIRLWDEKLKVEAKEKEESKKIEGEQKKLKAIFDDDVALLEEARMKLEDTIVPFITSDLTRRMLEKRLAELLAIKERIIAKGSLETESIEYFHVALANYISDLSKKETVLIHLPNTFGGRGGEPLSGSPKDPTIDPKDSNVYSVEQKNPLTSTQWEANRAREKIEKENEKDLAKSETARELLAIHKSRLDADPKGYIDMYTHKSWLRDDPNKEASLQVVEDYKLILERDRDELTRQCAHLKDILVEEPIPSGESLQQLRKEQVDALEQKISNLNKWIITIDKISTNNSKRLGTPKSPSHTSTLDATRVTLSPMRDKEKRKSNTALYGDASTPEKVQDVATRMQATHPYSAVDNVGMDHALGRAKPTIYETAYMPEPQTGVEKEKKLSAVRKLFTTLESKLPKNDWKVWAIAATSAVVLAGAAQLGWNKYRHKETHAIPEMNRTAGSTVSWKDTLTLKDTLKIQSAISHNDSIEGRNLNRTELFLHDLIGDKDTERKDLQGLFKKYAKNVSLDDNTSRLQDIGTWNCDQLLGSPEAVYGLTDKEREQVCRIINHLRVIVQAAEPSVPKGGAMTQNKHYSVSPHETIYDLFEAARRAAVEANQREEIESKK